MRQCVIPISPSLLSLSLPLSLSSVSRSAQHHLPLIDLKTACNDDADYANAIEPGVQGGEKITDNIVAVVEGHDFQGLSKIYSHGKEKTSKK